MRVEGAVLDVRALALRKAFFYLHLFAVEVLLAANLHGLPRHLAEVGQRAGAASHALSSVEVGDLEVFVLAVVSDRSLVE